MTSMPLYLIVIALVLAAFVGFTNPAVLALLVIAALAIAS
jgi:hypothetical protein